VNISGTFCFLPSACTNLYLRTKRPFRLDSRPAIHLSNDGKSKGAFCMADTMVLLKCAFCEKEFYRAASEANQSLKTKTGPFCNNHCHMMYRASLDDPIKRFWGYVDKNGPMSEAMGTQCWIWKGGHTRDGYGSMRLKSKGIKPHRFAYELLIGPIPENLELDHLCRNTGCCNPWHLEPVTSAVNILRSNNSAAVNARKDYCIHGHPLSGDNLVIVCGKRQCRACNRERTRKRREAQKNRL
jgi:hypothetical protein